MFESHVYRHPVSNKPVLGQPIGVDDFGNCLYECNFTKKIVHIGEGIYLGPVIPQVNGTYVCHPDAIEARKTSVKHFNEVEANCNTCKHLERVKHEKAKGGFLYGKCGKGTTKHLYPVNNGVIMFHPEDWMGMDCWEARS